jgi:membrane fusion protein (multidrug efflux system)
MFNPMYARALIAVALICTLAACGKGNKNDAAGRGQPAATVTTMQVQPLRWSDTLTALGTAYARESVTVTASVSQTIASVDFDSGQFAKKGQPLVTLVLSAQNANVAAAEASLRNAEQLYARNSTLAAQKLIAGADLATQKAALEAARAQVAAQRATVADRVIRAPFDGVLGLRLVSAGSLVTPGTAITTLDDVSLMKVDATFPESALPLLKAGQNVSVRSDAWPGENFDGKIAAIDARIDPMSRSIAIRAEIPNPDGKLRPGMLLQVNVERSTREALAVPEIALMQNGSQSSVFRVDASGEKVAQVPVKTGDARDGMVEILDGLAAGDRIVAEGTVKLRDGAKIVEAGNGERGTGNGKLPKP